MNIKVAAFGGGSHSLRQPLFCSGFVMSMSSLALVTDLSYSSAPVITSIGLGCIGIVRFVPKADIRMPGGFAVFKFHQPNLGLFQPGFAHALKEFRHRAGGIGNVAFDPRNRIFRLQFH